MNEVIVVAGATHRAGLLDEYEAQLAAAGVPFHLEPLTLPNGVCGITALDRIQYFWRIALQFLTYQTVYITDAWDVLFFGTREELIEKAPATFLCSAERNCYPEPEMATCIHGRTPWRYANNGMVAANTRYLLEWCQAALDTPDLSIHDQAWFNRQVAGDTGLAPLDDRTKLFYVVSATQEDGALKAFAQRPWNRRCGTLPNFLHFSGGCSTDGVREMLL